jgi:hypothetical protein
VVIYPQLNRSAERNSTGQAIIIYQLTFIIDHLSFGIGGTKAKSGEVRGGSVPAGDRGRMSLIRFKYLLKFLYKGW